MRSSFPAVLNPEKGHRFLPYIVAIVDEFADLIATSGKEIELPISRIAAKARAVGIHMILGHPTSGYESDSRVRSRVTSRAVSLLR